MSVPLKFHSCDNHEYWKLLPLAESDPSQRMNDIISPLTIHKSIASILTPIDMSEQNKLDLMNTVQHIRNELDTIEAPDAVVDSLNDVEDFLSSMPPRIDCSSMEKSDLAKLGVIRKTLTFIPEEVAKLAQDFTSQQSGEIQLLHARILDIHEHVNMDFVPRSRMILDSVVLALAKIASDPQSKTNVAIFPEMMVTPDDGVKVINRESGYQAWLSGRVGYAIIQYKDEYWNKRQNLIGDID
ncbi:hypothetical protein BJ138DRAFT_1115820 [Hygrophoropsis aurantiaca]|uniref:Uncharacterized protein n=1 Tax=Hygrophoropsis aurantiaca TaxID=72124 RepID=A0ACB8A5H2_9AGAM|nr:hypothetical protein BJ138DRAFT_1115820 [Hygrophoropsis aurantiaca]